jgi:non-ribosomal peptide synthetase component F
VLARAAGQEDHPVTAKAPASPVITVTQRLLDAAPSRGRHPALVGGPAGTSCSYAELADVVRAAAAGLAWRGLRPRDAVGIYVPDAATYTLGAHAVRAAGGVPSPVAAGLTVAEIAGQLTDCGARLLLTAPPLDAVAQEAADRSRVRQVISFGEAPGTVRFGALLETGTLSPAPARSQDQSLLPYSRALDGTLGPAPVSHDAMSGMLRSLDAEAEILVSDVVAAAPPGEGGCCYAARLDHALLRGATLLAACSDELTAAAVAYGATALITPVGCSRLA